MKLYSFHFFFFGESGVFFFPWADYCRPDQSYARSAVFLTSSLGEFFIVILTCVGHLHKL